MEAAGADRKRFSRWCRRQDFFDVDSNVFDVNSNCFHIQRDVDVKRALTETSKVKLTSRKMTPSVPNVKDA